MRGLHHREPGVVGSILGLDTLSADVILDGHHVDPTARRILYNAKGPRGLALITDAMQATGLGDGDYAARATATSWSGREPCAWSQAHWRAVC